MNPICEDCPRKQICKKEKAPCKALEALYEIGKKQDRTAKAELIRQYAKDLGVIEYEVSAELQQLGDKVIAGMPELSYISEFGIKVGYVISYGSKKKKRREDSCCRLS